jgi:hypothetical protein
VIRIYIPDDISGKGDIWSSLQRYMRELPKVIVKVCSADFFSKIRVSLVFHGPLLVSSISSLVIIIS